MQKAFLLFLSLCCAFLLALGPPTEQSDTYEDREIVNAIHNAIIADGNFSENAKGISIISNNRNVNLLGLVNSEKERKEIVRIAKSASRVNKVYDNLIVAPR